MTGIIDQLWRIRDWLAESHRTRILLVAVLALLMSTLMASHHYRVEQSGRRVEMESLLAWIEAQAPTVRAWQAAHPPSRAVNLSGSLMSAVSQAAAQAGLSVQRSATEPNGDVSVALSDARFDRLLPWLDTLTQTLQLRIESITLTRVEEAGLVDVQMRLRPSPVS